MTDRAIRDLKAEIGTEKDWILYSLVDYLTAFFLLIYGKKNAVWKWIKWLLAHRKYLKINLKHLKNIDLHLRNSHEKKLINSVFIIYGWWV